MRADAAMPPLVAVTVFGNPENVSTALLTVPAGLLSGNVAKILRMPDVPISKTDVAPQAVATACMRAFFTAVVYVTLML